MYQEQRLKKILDLLNEKGELFAKDMPSYLGVSRDTVRRDFSVLSERGSVVRTHGGIMKLSTIEPIGSFEERLKKFTPAKESIAYKIKNILPKNAVCFLDASTITVKLAEILTQEVSVYSHSLDVAIMLSNNDKVKFHLLGGKFFRKNRFYYSQDIKNDLENISFDVVILGSAGLKNNHLTLVEEEDVALKRAVLKNAKKKIIVAELEKFNQESNFILGNIEDFDLIITDEKPPQEILENLAEKIEIIW